MEHGINSVCQTVFEGAGGLWCFQVSVIKEAGTCYKVKSTLVYQRHSSHSRDGEESYSRTGMGYSMFLRSLTTVLAVKALESDWLL